MIDYSTAILEVKAITKEIHDATLKRDFGLAEQLTSSLSFAVEELFDAIKQEKQRNGQ